MEQRYAKNISSFDIWQLFQKLSFSHILVSGRVAIYNPPIQAQALNQGGTFVFDGDRTVFAHFDESTGAHSDIQQVIDLANDRVVVQQEQLVL